MYNLWSMSIGDYLAIMKEAIILGKERGKVEGDNLETEFFEIAKKKGLTEQIKHLGTTDKDKDLLCGDMREEGLKVLNLSELERQNKLKDEIERKRKNDMPR